MLKVVRKSEASVRQVSANKTARDYITKDISPDVSLAVTTATGYDEIETTPYDRIYYVLAGELSVSIKGYAAELAAGDSCFIPAGTSYDMKGTFEVLVVNRPAIGTL